MDSVPADGAQVRNQLSRTGTPHRCGTLALSQPDLVWVLGVWGAPDCAEPRPVAGLSFPRQHHLNTMPHTLHQATDRMRESATARVSQSFLHVAPSHAVPEAVLARSCRRQISRGNGRSCARRSRCACSASGACPLLRTPRRRLSR